MDRFPLKRTVGPGQDVPGYCADQRKTPGHFVPGFSGPKRDILSRLIPGGGGGDKMSPPPPAGSTYRPAALDDMGHSALARCYTKSDNSPEGDLNN